jgi:hypothetical protein
MKSIIPVSAESDFKPLAFCWKMWWVGTVCILDEFVRFDLKFPSQAWRGKWRMPSFLDPLTRSVLRRMPKPPETLEAFARWLLFFNQRRRTTRCFDKRNNVRCPCKGRALVQRKKERSTVPYCPWRSTVTYGRALLLFVTVRYRTGTVSCSSI